MCRLNNRPDQCSYRQRFCIRPAEYQHPRFSCRPFFRAIEVTQIRCDLFHLRFHSLPPNPPCFSNRSKFIRTDYFEGHLAIVLYSSLGDIRPAPANLISTQMTMKNIRPCCTTISTRPVPPHLGTNLSDEISPSIVAGPSAG